MACQSLGVYSVVKRLLIGSPVSSAELEEQRLTKRVALAVFGTDAIASTVFATQEILETERGAAADRHQHHTSPLTSGDAVGRQGLEP